MTNESKLKDLTKETKIDFPRVMGENEASELVQYISDYVNAFVEIQEESTTKKEVFPESYQIPSKYNENLQIIGKITKLTEKYEIEGPHQEDRFSLKASKNKKTRKF